MRNQHVQLEISSMNKNDPFRNDSQAKHVEKSTQRVFNSIWQQEELY